MGFGKDGKGAIVKEQTSLALAGLAGQDFVAATSGVVLDMDFRILKTDVTAVARGLTSGEGGGLILYLFEGDLSAAEAEVNIEQNGPVRLGKQIEEELASRWIRRVGILDNGVETERIFRDNSNSGLMEIKPRWTFRRGRTGADGGWNWGVYNSGVTVTTGIILDIVCTHYGVWVT